MPRGFEIKLNGVRFDGCREADGTMLEAKGPGYADKMTSPETWEVWYRGDKEIEKQMKDQSDAAPDRIVEWHFAEREVAQYFLKNADKRRLTNIVVIYTPAK